MNAMRNITRNFKWSIRHALNKQAKKWNTSVNPPRSNEVRYSARDNSCAPVLKFSQASYLVRRKHLAVGVTKNQLLFSKVQEWTMIVLECQSYLKQNC